MRLRDWVVDAPTRSDFVVRWAVAVACVTGVLGGTAGLVIGLSAHPATAWFAVLEVGVPSAVVGAVLGASVGAVLATRRDWPGVDAR